MPGSPVVHWELMSRQPENVAQFDYRIVETGSEMGINGDIVKPDKPEPWPGNMVLYIAVDDLAAYRKKVEDAGGRIHVREPKVPGMGKFSLFTDPEGRMMGLWKAKT